ncbi:MAG TPA: glycosyltransferase family 2 protein [Hyphomicrobium sp.]|nr:glycosyltransferase family 2 protein [Hyphomicrobium sp.]
MEHLTIGIASIGRSGLLKMLSSLDEIDVPADLSVEILVADDDPAGGAVRLLSDRKGKLPVRVLSVGSRNIATARNACLDHARGMWMAFVDDDEIVARDWLVRLFAAMNEFRADVVVGPVYPVYPPETPDWLQRANPLYVDWGRRGALVDTGRSGNVLFRRDDARWSALRFDAALGRSGGEDTDFFHRLHRAGAVIVVTDDARIEEEAPAARLDRGYLRRRALRSGQSYARFRLGGAGRYRPRSLAFYALALGKAAVGFSFALALRPFDRGRSFALMQKGWLNVGKLRHFAALELPTMY